MLRAPMLAPDIHYSGTFIVDRGGGNVLFRGAVSDFPAFEICFRVNDGPVGTLAQISPIPPEELIGKENRSVRASARIEL